MHTLHEPIRAFFQEHKGGNTARNYGLREARGRYVKFLDDDDWLIANMVDQQVQYLDQHPEIDICYSDFGTVLASGDIKITNRTLNTSLDNLIVGKGRYHIGNPIHAYALRYEVACKASWDEALSSSQDRDYFLTLALEGASFGYLPGCVAWTRHDRQRKRVTTSANRSKQAEIQRNKLVVLTKAQTTLENRGDLSAELRQLLAKRYFQLAAELYLIINDRAEFQRWLGRIRKLYPDFRPDTRMAALLSDLIGYPLSIKVLHLRKVAKAKIASLLGAITLCV